jgi:hypothetical protein
MTVAEEGEVMARVAAIAVAASTVTLGIVDMGMSSRDVPRSLEFSSTNCAWANYGSWQSAVFDLNQPGRQAAMI